MKKSIKINYIYNLSYQILVLITPLITTPYLSRVLNADGIGVISFAESIVSYFTLVATLGITTYGQREITYVQDDIIKRSLVFWETKLLEVVICLMVILSYVVFAFFQENKILYFILTFNLLAVLVDIVWFFQGLEEFGKIVFRNFLFKIINIVYIFVFIKDRGDILKYAFGISFLLFLSNLSLWPYLKNYICKPIWKEIKVFRNIKTVLSLFIPTVAIQVYTVLDKTMIGLITRNDFENGYYEQSIKIARILLTVVTSLGTVMIPRIGYHFGKGETEVVKSYMYRGYRFVWFLGMPLCFGLIGIASNFVPWFFGNEYAKVVPLLSILAFLVLAIGINNVTGMQYLIPTKRQNLFTMTVLIGAVVNCILNFILIRYFESIGAAIASVAAETTIALVQLLLVRKELSFWNVIGSCIHYFVASGVMLIFLKIIGKRLTSTFLHTMIMILFGALIYFMILLLYRDSFFIENIESVFKKIKTKIKRG